MNAPLALCAVLTLCLAVPAQAAMYKWVDKDGSVVYSETPPPDGTDAITLTLQPPPDVPENPAENTAPLGQSASDGSNDTSAGINEENERVRQRFEEARRHNCETARQNLQTYRTAARIRTPDNQVVNLDEATRAARIQQAERDIATYCK